MRFTDDPRRSAEALYVDQHPESRVSSSILAFVRERAGRRVIDFGCGTGGYAALLRRSGFDVTAVDRNPAYVAAAASLGVPAQRVNGALPFPDGAFDPILPHLLLPPIVRRPLSALYRLGILRPSLYSRLFAEARVDV